MLKYVCNTVLINYKNVYNTRMFITLLFSSQQRIIKNITPETPTEIPYGDIRLNAV